MTRSAVAAWPAAAGVFCIFGGEALCIAGPIRENEIHLVCHTIFSVGIAMVHSYRIEECLLKREWT